MSYSHSLRARAKGQKIILSGWERVDGDSRPVLAVLRVSTARQGEDGHSLTNQRKQVIALAASMGDTIHDEDIYVDTESGTKASRPAIDKAIARIETGYYRRCYTVSQDRLLRNDELHITLFKAMEAGNCWLVLPTGEVDMRDAMARLIALLTTAIAKLEVEKVHDRVVNNLHGMVEDGLWTGSKPYGYEWRPTGEVSRFGKRLGGLVPAWRNGDDGLPLPTCPPMVVLRIFKEYDNGSSPHTIAVGLNQQGILGPRVTPRGRIGGELMDTEDSGKPTLWNVRAIKCILANKAYIGVYEYGKKSKHGWVTTGEWPFEQWVPRDLFESVQLRLVGQAGICVHGPNTVSSPWHRLIVCGVCGHQMVKWTNAVNCRKYRAGGAEANKGNMREYQTCRGAYKPGGAGKDGRHPQLNVRADRLTEMAGVVLEIASKCQPPITDAPNRNDEDIAREWAIINRMRADAQWAFLDPTCPAEARIDRDRYVSLMRIAQSREERLAPIVEFQPELQRVIRLTEVWPLLTVQEQNRELRRLVSGVIVTEDAVVWRLHAWQFAGWPLEVHFDRLHPMDRECRIVQRTGREALPCIHLIARKPLTACNPLYAGSTLTPAEVASLAAFRQMVDSAS